jgi:hydroxymethylglutaryl-CoA lyase
MMTLPSAAFVTEVGPRDGLQSAGTEISTQQKIGLVDALSATGVQRIEVTSFVHPKLVPSMADAEEVMRSIHRREGVIYQALVPNLRGAERAIAAGADELNVVLSATESFNQRNLNMSVAQSVENYAQINAMARSTGLRAEVGMSVVFGCPYERAVSEAQVLEVIERTVDAGAEEVLLADTIGVANPRAVQSLVAQVRARWPTLTIGLHFHDTRGLGLANLLAGFQLGVSRFDASVGGIGACPFAPGATGNICTEDAVHMLELIGVQSGVDLELLIECARLVEAMVQQPIPSRLARAGRAQRVLQRSEASTP